MARARILRFTAGDGLAWFVEHLERPGLPGLGTGWGGGTWSSLPELEAHCGPEARFRDKNTGRRQTLQEYMAAEPPGYLFEFLGHRGDAKDRHQALRQRVRQGLGPAPEFGAPERDLFERPRYTQRDFELEQKPENHWLLVGREGTGSTLHVDPNGTSAWNTLLCGHKLWTLVPPCQATAGLWDAPENLVSPSMCGKAQLEVVARARLGPDGPSESIEVIQFEQKPGETVFLPRGWAHAVTNLDTTIAVTGNYAPAEDIEHVLGVMELYGGEPYRDYWRVRFSET